MNTSKLLTKTDKSLMAEVPAEKFENNELDSPLTDEELNEFLHEIFADLQNDEAMKDLNVFFSKDTGLPSCEFHISGREDDEYSIICTLPTGYLKLSPVIVGLKPSLKKTYNFILPDYKASPEEKRAFKVRELKGYVVGYLRGIQASFRETVNNICWFAYGLQQISKAQLYAQHAKAEDSNFKPKPIKQTADSFAKAWAEVSKLNQEKMFLNVAETFIPDVNAPEPGPKKIIFAVYYIPISKIWQKASKLYKANKIFPDMWRETVSRVSSTFPLPVDLIERLASRDSMEKMPSSIALEHTARLLNLGAHSRSTLNGYLQESRKWLESSPHEILQITLNAHNVPENLREWLRQNTKYKV